MRWLLIASFVLVLNSISRADVGVFVVGESTLQPPVLVHAESWLRDRGHVIVASALSPESINRLIDCFVTEEARCARGVVESRSKSDAVLLIQVSVGSGITAMDRTVTVAAHWIRRGGDTASERLFCEKCTSERLRETVEMLLVALAANANSDFGRVRVVAPSRGARVSLHGRLMGRTPLELVLVEGKHELKIEAPDRRPEPRVVSVRRGETAEINLAAPTPRASRAPYALLAGSAVLLAGAVALVLIDEDYRSVSSEQRRLQDTAPLGYALGGAGALAGALGVYLLVRSPRSGPAASVSSGGAHVSWRASF